MSEHGRGGRRGRTQGKKMENLKKKKKRTTSGAEGNGNE